MRRGLVTLSLLTGLIATGAWAAVGESAPDLAATLLRASGMERQIASIAPSFDAQLAGSGDGISEDVRARLLETARRSFAADPLHRAALAHLNAHMDPARAQRALVWLRSEQGRRITRLEEAASEPEAVKALQEYAQSLGAKPPEAARVALITRLDAATGATDLTAKFLYEMAAATARGMLAVSESSQDASELEAALAGQKSSIAETARNMTLVSMLFTYRALSAEEVSSYIEFLETDAGRWYQSTTGHAFFAALRDGTKRFESEIAGAAKAASE
jgi:hypothetical protein